MADLRHIDLEEAASLLLLIAREDPEKLAEAVVRFLGRACLECHSSPGTAASGWPALRFASSRLSLAEAEAALLLDLGGDG